MVELICESQDFKTDPLQPICIVQDKGKLCSSPELKQWIWNYVTTCSGYHRVGVNLTSLTSLALDHEGQIHKHVPGTIKKRLPTTLKHAFLKVGEMPLLAVRFSS